MNFINGYKTRIAATLTLLVALNGALAAFGLPHLTDDQQQAVLTLAAALGLWGIGHKLEKLGEAGPGDDAP